MNKKEDKTSFKKETKEDEFTTKAILNDDEIDLIYGQIYIITCNVTAKQYVGQAISHRKNHNKYRTYGYIGRFNGHISEAIRNTKKMGCTYLNSAIRKYGKENFDVELLENCPYNEIDNLEKYYVKKYNTLAPNGYNLTVGGKSNYTWVNPKLLNINNELDEQGVNIVLKRGRNFGYTHKTETIDKMKKYYETISEKDAETKKKTMQKTMSEHHETKRIDMLLKLGIQFDEDFDKYIRPKKKGDEIVGYVIRINRTRHGEITNKDISVQEKYDMLYNALKGAHEKQQQENIQIEKPPKKVRSMFKHHEQKRITSLLNTGVEFDEDFAKYIKPKKKGDEIIGYYIGIKRKAYGNITAEDLTNQEKYDMLRDSLKKAYDKQQEEKV
jgi:hypothetical protein